MNNENIAGSIKISKWKVQCSLLWVTAPLFIGTFLQFYIGNAPKYAIDSVMDDQAQAVYGYISMPVFVIGLFAMFIFGPIYHSISVLWNKGDVKGFVSLIRKQLLYTLLIAILCILLGYFFGLPVLSFLYDIDLSGYLFEFMILLVSGGFFAATTLFVLVLTIIRFQRAIVIGYLSVSVCALIFARPVVATAGMTGASILNFLFTVGLASVMGCFSIYGVKRQESSEN
ncbi:hypothetical protein AGMMS49983_09390 [Clostridia bacterium]|nr:hypothetical protein AGMMS49983_09390 [Clostridia bacterium]